VCCRNKSPALRWQFAELLESRFLLSAQLVCDIGPGELVLELITADGTRAFPRADVLRVEIVSGGGDDSIECDVFGGIGYAVPTFIDAGDGSDTVICGSAADTVLAGAGGDNVSAGSGDDHIGGGGGVDLIEAGLGNDITTRCAVTLGTTSSPATMASWMKS